MVFTKFGNNLPDYFSLEHYPGLFRSYSWLHAWKTIWGNEPAIELCFEGNLNQSVYSYKQNIKRIIPVVTAFPLGISTSAAPSIRSEYFFLPEKSNNDSVGAAKTYLNAIAIAKWDQFYIPDVLAESADFFALQQAASLQQWDFVIADKNTTYGIDVSNHTFPSYLASLGANTRLKLYNRRKNLDALGQLEIQNIWPDKNHFIEIINVFHERRWGKPCYQGKNAAFICLLLEGLVKEGHSVDLSVMTIDKQPISVVLDIRVNGRVYNLQSGYLEDFAKGISLGTLHFGYQIEAAFKSDQIDFYDFMAGNGKNSNYKASLANKTAQFNTVILVRNPILKMLYKIRKWFGK